MPSRTAQHRLCFRTRCPAWRGVSDTPFPAESVAGCVKFFTPAIDFVIPAGQFFAAPLVRGENIVDFTISADNLTTSASPGSNEINHLYVFCRINNSARRALLGRLNSRVSAGSGGRQPDSRKYRSFQASSVRYCWNPYPRVAPVWPLLATFLATGEEVKLDRSATRCSHRHLKNTEEIAPNFIVGCGNRNSAANTRHQAANSHRPARILGMQ